MKYLLISLLAMFIASVDAQITVTNDNLAPAGTTFYNSVDTIVEPSIVPGGPGAGKTWNFMGLSSDYVDTLVFMLPDWTPYPDNFPASNFAVNLVDNDAFAYFLRNDDEFSALGVAGPFQDFDSVSAAISPKEIFMDFPVEYGNSRSESFVVESKFASDTPPADSILYRQTTFKTSFVDAWGSLSLAIGTYDVLRVKENRTVSDSVWAKIFGIWIPVENSQTASLKYKWMTDDVNIGYYLVSMKYDSASQTVGSVEYMSELPVGVDNNAQDAFLVYPNPCSSRINFKFDNDLARRITIFDVHGRMIMDKLQQSPNTSIQLSSFPKGIYFYSIENMVSKKKTTGKFIKN
ncbi:MAG: T9SS type A sorting domain-containing protein [Chlorobi bacterium]|nr:T9SS type A sorting domain-containing protein [Chlorobiota bacterium]